LFNFYHSKLAELASLVPSLDVDARRAYEAADSPVRAERYRAAFRLGGHPKSGHQWTPQNRPPRKRPGRVHSGVNLLSIRPDCGDSSTGLGQHAIAERGNGVDWSGSRPPQAPAGLGLDAGRSSPYLISGRADRDSPAMVIVARMPAVDLPGPWSASSAGRT
jgi:hypothetical protein